MHLKSSPFELLYKHIIIAGHCCSYISLKTFSRSSMHQESDSLIYITLQTQPSLKMQASEPLSSSSFRYMSENIQFSRMKDVILPQVSTHQLYSYGYDDFSSDIPMQIDYKTNAYESNFYMDSSLYIQQDQLITEAFCTEPCINNYQSGPSSQMTIKSLDCPSFGASHLSIKSPTVPNDYDNSTKQQQQLSHLQTLVPQQLKENPICSTRKSPIESSNIIQKRSPEEKPSESEWTSTKKRAVCCQEQFQDYQNHKEIKIQKERAPVKRSQKLADRITALQKLVSPYGKTDTASVLYEASIFIKALQDQMENMLNTQSSSSPADNKSIQHKNTGEKQLDLRNKGLCLAPVSLTRKLIKQDAFNQYSS